MAAVPLLHHPPPLSFTLKPKSIHKRHTQTRSVSSTKETTHTQPGPASFWGEDTCAFWWKTLVRHDKRTKVKSSLSAGLTFHPELLDVRLDGRHPEPHRQRSEHQQANEEHLPAVALDLAAQREEQGLEPRADPQRCLLTYRFTLETRGELLLQCMGIIYTVYGSYLCFPPNIYKCIYTHTYIFLWCAYRIEKAVSHYSQERCQPPPESEITQHTYMDPIHVAVGLLEEA